MEKINESDVEFRQGGNYGSKYLFRRQYCEGGKIVIPPNAKYAERAHYHKGIEEIFWFIEGEPLLLVGDEKIRVKQGDVYVIQPREEHNVLNDTSNRCLICFIKSPIISGDRFEVKENGQDDKK